jgi:hypothetical protein
MNHEPVFVSDITEVGATVFPEWSGIRVQHMPILMHDPESLPDSMPQWRQPLATLFSMCREAKGVGYLTVDELDVPRGVTHRRPGLHVDGIGTWGHGTWASDGMLTTSNVAACVAWKQNFHGYPVSGIDAGDPREGDCEHLREQCRNECGIVLQPGIVYRCSPLCVHESFPMKAWSRRTFVRLSMPSSCPWPMSCTPNPKVKPGGPIAGPRRIEGRYGY